MKVLVLGAGQLARMMSLAGTPLNLKVSAYDVNSDTIVDPVTQQQLGTGLAQAIANADVITSEFEHIPYPVQELCQQSGKFFPGETAIKAGVKHHQYHQYTTKTDSGLRISFTY